MHGEIGPGQALTLRGLAGEFDVSMTPAREALRRLSAEGALTVSSSGRVTTPELSNERIEELAALRSLLEVELASRALPRAHIALIDRLQTINARITEDIARQDAVAYIRRNLEFHRTLYLRAQAPAMLAMAETVWLQLGPTMRALYGRLRPQGAAALSPPDHRRAQGRGRTGPAPRRALGRDAGPEDAGGMRMDLADLLITLGAAVSAGLAADHVGRRTRICPASRCCWPAGSWWAARPRPLPPEARRSTNSCRSRR